jgi:hypothetical protein
MAELRKDYPREVPIITKTIEIANTMMVTQAAIECQVKALVKYHKTCAKAMEKLVEELNTCSLKKHKD